MIRSRRPETFFSSCGHEAEEEALERENAILKAALTEALQKFRFVQEPGRPELDRWQGVMAPAVYQRLSELAATREGT